MLLLTEFLFQLNQLFFSFGFGIRTDLEIFPQA